MQPIPANLLEGNNRELLSFLQGRSCHGDNTESLQNILSCYADVHCFCPDARNYRYFLWYRGNTIFAYGVGMRGVSLRIAAAHVALADGLAIEKKRFDGYDWYALAPDCEPLDQLARQAYEDAGA